MLNSTQLNSVFNMLPCAAAKIKSSSQQRSERGIQSRGGRRCS